MHNGSFRLQRGSTHVGYSVSGKGVPLLIASVPWGVDGHRWTSLDRLADQFTLIRIDPRGTGMSGDVQQKEEYGVPTLVDDIEAVRIHLGVEQWNIMGQSAAGWTALEYTLQYQRHVRQLAVICSAPTGKFHTGTFRDPSHPLYNTFEQISREVRTLPARERVTVFNRAVYKFDIQKDSAKQVIDDIFSAAEFNAQRNQYFVMHELNRYNVVEQLRDIVVPTLVIGGIHDVHVAPSWSDMMARQIPHSRLVMMEHSGHFPWLDEPTKFFETIAEFFG